jgi:hypothetical protein
MNNGLTPVFVAALILNFKFRAPRPLYIFMLLIVGAT